MYFPKPSAIGAPEPELASDVLRHAEPTTEWFDERRYFAGHTNPFFANVGGGAKGLSAARKEDMPWFDAIRDIIDGAPNLQVVHRALMPGVSAADGTLALSQFMRLLVSTLVPEGHEDAALFRTWYGLVGAPMSVPLPEAASPPIPGRSPAGAATVDAASPYRSIAPSAASSPQKGASRTPGFGGAKSTAAAAADDEGPTDLVLPYLDVVRALDNLLVREAATSVRWAFDLCDLGATGYILRDTMKHIRTRDAAVMNFGEEGRHALPRDRADFITGSVREAAKANSAPPRKIIGADAEREPTRKETTLQVDTPEGLTCNVAKAALRCFEHVAAEELERAVAAGGKKSKKKKKGAAPVLPVMRQFHVSFAEFKEYFARDGYIAAAFLPYVVKQWVVAAQAKHAAAKSGAESPIPHTTGRDSAPLPPEGRGDGATTSAASAAGGGGGSTSTTSPQPPSGGSRPPTATGGGPSPDGVASAQEQPSPTASPQPPPSAGTPAIPES